jgi:hypothetical protein
MGSKGSKHRLPNTVMAPDAAALSDGRAVCDIHDLPVAELFLVDAQPGTTCRYARQLSPNCLGFNNNAVSFSFLQLNLQALHVHL